MTHFRLPDTVNAPKTLFQSVGVPRQIVVDHQVRALQVDALPCRVRGDENERFFVLREGFLRFAPFFAPDAAVDNHNGLFAA